MPNYIERELKALPTRARLDVEIHGKELLSPHGEYVPALVVGGLRKFFTLAPLSITTVTALRTATPRSRPRRDGARVPAAADTTSGRRRSAPAVPSARCSAP